MSRRFETNLDVEVTDAGVTVYLPGQKGDSIAFVRDGSGGVKPISQPLSGVDPYIRDAYRAAHKALYKKEEA